MSGLLSHWEVMEKCVSVQACCVNVSAGPCPSLTDVSKHGDGPNTACHIHGKNHYRVSVSIGKLGTEELGTEELLGKDECRYEWR